MNGPLNHSYCTAQGKAPSTADQAAFRRPSG